MTGRTSAATGAGAAGGGDARRPAGDGTGAGPGRRRAATFRGGLAKVPRRGVLCAREEDYNKLYTVPPIVPPKAMQAGRRTLAKHRPAGSTAQQAAPPSRQHRPGQQGQPRQAPTRAGTSPADQPAGRPAQASSASQPRTNAHARARFKTRARAGELYRARARGSSRGAAFVCGFGSAKFF